MKKQGGPIGLTETPTALLRWMVAGPEMARVVTEFLEGIDKPGQVSDTRHHGDNPAAQATFLRHVQSLVSSISEMGNPFMDPSRDLLILDTRVVETVQTIEKIGQQRCDSFYQDCLIARTKLLNDTITKAKLPLFHRHVHKDKSRQQNQVKALKSDRTLFSTLYVAFKFDTVTWLIFSHMRINRIRLPCLTMEL